MSKINRYAETLIRQLIAAGTAYQAEVNETVEKYKSEMQQVQRTADQRYATQQNADRRQMEEEERIMDKYKTAYIDEKKSALTAASREKIRIAQDSFQAVAKEAGKALRKLLEESIISPINPGFLRLAETLKTFNLAPSRLELDALLILTEGNLTATRCLDALLKETHAPFTLSYKSVDAFSKDLELVEQLSTDDYFCSPMSTHHQMCEIFKGERVYRDENSVGFKRGETFDSVPLLIYGQSFTTAMENLEAMIPSWGADIHYEAADALSAEMEEQEKVAARMEGRKPELTDYESPTKVQESGEDGTALAVELGREAAAAKAPVSESLGDLVK